MRPGYGALAFALAVRLLKNIEQVCQRPDEDQPRAGHREVTGVRAEILFAQDALAI